MDGTAYLRWGGSLSSLGLLKQLVHEAVRFLPRNANLQARAKELKVPTVYVAVVANINGGVAHTQRVTQVTDEFEILKEEVRADLADNRCQKSGMPVQTLPESPFFVSLRRVPELLAEQRLERQPVHRGRVR
jgi:hypothetical protein